jgi:hypothetical protein
MRCVVMIAVTAGVLFAGAGSAHAATTRYASPSGGGDCSSAAGPCTLAQANAASAAGDTISLARGEYPSLGDVSITPGVILAGAAPLGDLFDFPAPPGEVSVLHVGTLTVSGGALRDVMVIGTTSGSVLAADGTAIERVFASDDRGSSYTSACAFAGLVARDSVCLADWAGAAVTVSGSSELRNVTARAGAGDGIRVTGPAQVLVHNTSASGATSLVVTDPGAAVSVDHSQYSNWSGPAGTVTFGAGNVGFGPLPVFGLCDDGLASVHQPEGTPFPGSPAIDAGGAVDPGEADVLGRPRAQAAAPDIGAYEYQPAQPCVAGPQADPVAGGVRLSAAVGPHDAVTTYAFEWGPTTAYGAATAPVQLPATTASVPVSATLSGLAPGMTYYVRIVATNAYGTTSGFDTPFTTPPPAAQSPVPKAKPKVTIGLPKAGHCRASRTLTLRPRIAKGGTIIAVSVYVRGKRRVRVTGARARRAIRITHLPAGRYTVEVRVRTKDGRVVKAKRTYKRCR